MTVPHLVENDVYSPLIGALEPHQFHHYSVKKIATQYCTFQKKRDSRSSEKWQAKHTETDFDSFEKLCDAVDYFVDQDRKYIDGLPNKKAGFILLTYPVLLLGGKLVESSPAKNNLNLKECDHVQFVRTRAHQMKSTQYNIDVINEGYLPTLVGQINSEIKEIAKRLMKNDCAALRNSFVYRPQVKVFRPGSNES